MLNKFIKWLILSAKNPGEVSLTVKSALLALIPIVTIGLNLAHINAGSVDMTAMVDSLIGLFQGVLAVVSTVGIVWGLARKIALSLTIGHANLK